MRAARFRIDILGAAQQCRVVLGVLGLLYLGLVTTPQASDLLIALGQDGSVVAWLGLAAATAWLALNAWFWSRFALTHSLRARHGRSMAWVPRLLAAIACLIVAAGLWTAASGIPPNLVSLGGGLGDGIARLVAASGVVGGAGLLILVLFLRKNMTGASAAGSGLGRAAWLMLLTSVAVGAVGMAGFGIDPVATATVLPPASTALFAASGLMSGGTLLLYLGQRTRVPVLFLMFVLAAALAVLRDRDIIADNHDVRRVAAPLRARPTVEAAFLHFLDAAGPPGSQPVPVVLVAAGGGGIAAAYWTATVLGDLANASPAFAGQVFAMSGVSGGGLGLLAYAAAGRGPPACTDPRAPAGGASPDRLRACLQLALGGDFLGPTLGALLYPDLMQRFLPAVVFADRAQALEQSWEARWRAVFGDGRLAGPFLDLWQDGRPWPALLLNGTATESGGRLIASNLDLDANHTGGDRADLLARLGTDTPASTAAGSGARFPYVSPIGVLRSPATGRVTGGVADGGYFENLGSATLLETLDILDVLARDHQRHVRFVIVQLTNGPETGASDTSPMAEKAPWSLLPRGLVGPVAVLLQTRTARGVSASRALARRVAALSGTYITVRLGQLPGGRAAPLGWSLSAVARQIIDAQWTPSCRDRVLADAGFAHEGGSPPTAACQAVDAAVP